MATHASNNPRLGETVIKQGYLKRTITSKDFLPSAPKQLANSILQKIEPLRWYVFGVSYSKPYLEYYNNEETVFTGQAIRKYDLSSFTNLTYTLGRTNPTFTFCIFLEDDVIELTAPSRSHMVQWCRCIEISLRNMGYRGKHYGDDHTYSAFPVKDQGQQQATPIVDDPEGIYITSVMDDDHIYSDPLDAVAETNDAESATIPKTAGDVTTTDNADKEESVFASLYSVFRDSLTRPVSQPIYDFGISPEEDSRKVVGGACGNVKDEHDGGDTDTHTQEQKPQVPTQLESDTSEDSDFLSTSFWMRNRKLYESKDDSVLVQRDKDTRHEPPLFADSSLYSSPPPPVPLRQNSKQRPRDCFSLFVNDTSVVGRVSPTLFELGVAPPVSDRVNLYSAVNDTPLEKSDMKSKGSEVNNNIQENDTCPQHLLKATSVTVEQRNTLTTATDKVPHIGEDVDDMHIYEEVCAGRIGPTANGLAAVNLDYELTDSIYETSWGVKGNPGLQESDPKELVDLLKTDTDTVCQLEGEGSSASGDELQKDVGVKHAKKKSSKHFFHSFKKSSRKYKELPEGLTVLLPAIDKSTACNVPPGNCCASENSANELIETSGNFYSDFPLDGESVPKSPPKYPGLESDILKLAQEKCPTVVPQTSPELPKRTDFRLVTRMPSPVPVIPTKSGSNTPTNTDGKLGILSPMTADNVSSGVHDNILPVAPPRKTQFAKKPKKSKGAIGYEHFSSEENTDDMPVLPPKTTGDRTAKQPDFISSSKSEDTIKVTGSPPIVKKNMSPVLPKRILNDSPTAAIPKLREPLKQYDIVPKPRPRSQKMIPKGLSVIQNEEKPSLPPRARSIEANDIPPPSLPKRVIRSKTCLDEAKRDQYFAVRARPSHLSVRQQLSAHSGGLTVMNLKQNQVDILRAEIDSTGGLVQTIPKAHFQQGLAIVECFERLWIAGWDVKKYPRLYDKFHIGDEVLAINDVRVMDLGFAQKLVKNIAANSIELNVRRLPNAKTYAIQRESEGESLGFMRDGGTAEIVYVDPHGLAHRHGLTNKSKTMEGDGMCSWVLTEINNRPLSLFFKQLEIEHRLMAVGKDISIVVQPSDFISEVKKQLKKIRSYKDYVVQ